MGSFVQKLAAPFGTSGVGRYMNPMSAIDPVQTFAGNHSWAARMASYDPLMKTSAGAVVDPQAHANGQAYSNRLNTGPQTPGAFAGAQPTLQDATNQYARQLQTYSQPRQTTAMWS